MSDAPQNSFRSRWVATACAALLAGTTLGGLAAPAQAQNALRPSGMSQKLPDFVDLAKQVRPAVVSITSMLKDDGSEDDEAGGGGGEGGGQQMPFPFPFQMTPQNHGSRTVEARGSGFIISADGYIVTNNHVVKNATSVSVTLDDGTTLKAKVVGHDNGTDIALLKVKPSAKLSFIQLGESDDVQPGEWVIAVGNPYGLGGSVTAGIVSARGRDIGDGPYESFIQVDAPINRGNSGGPLFTQDGKVVGVNSAIISPSGGSVGIGFAIPSSLVRDVVGQIRTAGHVTRGYLGVEAQEVTPDIAASLGLKAGTHGALVAATQPDSPAAKAGVQPGDIVESVDSKPVTSPHDLASIVAAVHPGGTAQVAILRNGTDRTLSVAVATLPDEQPAAQEAQASEGPTVGLALAPTEDGSAGAVVAAVRPDSAAAKAGLRPGDEVVSVGAHAVATAADAAKAIRAAAKDGHGLALRVMRDGHARYVAIPGALKG